MSPGQTGQPKDLFEGIGPASTQAPSADMFEGLGPQNTLTSDDHEAPETSLGVIGTLKQYAHMPIDVYHAFTTPPQDETEKGLARGGGPVALGAKRLLYDPQKNELMKAAKYREKARSATSTIESLSASAGEVGHLITAAIPMLGPWAASIGEQAGGGDISGAATNATVGLLLPKLVGKTTESLA